MDTFAEIVVKYLKNMLENMDTKKNQDGTLETFAEFIKTFELNMQHSIIGMNKKKRIVRRSRSKSD